MIVSGSFVVGISRDAPVIVKIKKKHNIVGIQPKCVGTLLKVPLLARSFLLEYFMCDSH